jgi:hypothetical protein
MDILPRQTVQKAIINRQLPSYKAGGKLVNQREATTAPIALARKARAV